MERLKRIEKLQRKAGFYDVNDKEYSASLKNEIVNEGLGLISDILTDDKMRNGLIEGGKMNEAARQMVMDKHGLSFDKPLDSLITLLPLCKERAQKLKKDPEQIHYDMAYFDLCEMLWDKYKEDNNLTFKSEFSLFIASPSKMKSWSIDRFSKYLSNHIDKMIRCNIVKNPTKFGTLIEDLDLMTDRVNWLGMQAIMET